MKIYIPIRQDTLIFAFESIIIIFLILITGYMTPLAIASFYYLFVPGTGSFAVTINILIIVYTIVWWFCTWVFLFDGCGLSLSFKGDIE